MKREDKQEQATLVLKRNMKEWYPLKMKILVINRQELSKLIKSK